MTDNIPFNVPPRLGGEEQFVADAIAERRLCGDGPFSRRCETWFEERFGFHRALLTTSCTHALELASLLIGIGPGDEVILPSYTFVSTATAFVLRGARVVFVDIRPDTQNINEALIEDAISERTKAIIPVHYAGVSCDMDMIGRIARKHNLWVVEDAAQGMMSTYNGNALGGIGHLGAFSFHETKNYTSGGEGGLLIINEPILAERAEIIREKGTNRSQFLRGAIDKYSWVDIGSSYLPSELQAAYLWGQLQGVDKINDFRLKLWNKYYKELSFLEDSGVLSLPFIPQECVHNAHMFYLKLSCLKEREALRRHLRENGIQASFHYVPLHSSDFGKNAGFFIGNDNETTKTSDTLLRLPLWYGLDEGGQSRVIGCIKEFFD